jgi:hypothetical protein
MGNGTLDLNILRKPALHRLRKMKMEKCDIFVGKHPLASEQLRLSTLNCRPAAVYGKKLTGGIARSVGGKVY